MDTIIMFVVSVAIYMYGTYKIDMNRQKRKDEEEAYHENIKRTERLIQRQHKKAHTHVFK